MRSMNKWCCCLIFSFYVTCEFYNYNHYFQKAPSLKMHVRWSQLELDRTIEGGLYESVSFDLARSHIVSLGLNGFHLDSLDFTLSHSVSLGLTWTHLDSLGFTWIHLDSLGLTWIRLDSLGLTWIHLDSLGFTWTHLDSLGFTWIRLDSSGLTWTHLDSLNWTHWIGPIELDSIMGSESFCT